MNGEQKPLAEINQRAVRILMREMGVVDTFRFLGQFRTGAGDYTKERGQWLDNLSLDEITSEIKAKKQRRGG